MKWLDEMLQLPRLRSWVTWLTLTWTLILLAPFALYGENWGMIFYYLTWPLSESLKSAYEDFGDTTYVGMVSAAHVTAVFMVALLVNNMVRMIRMRQNNKEDTRPPTTTVRL